MEVDLMNQLSYEINKIPRTPFGNYINPENPNFALSRFSEICIWKRENLLRKNNQKMGNYIQEGIVKTQKTIDLINDWPTNPIIDAIIEQIKPKIKTIIEERKVMCDEKDLLFQVIFRLTTFSIKHVFNKGTKLEKIIQKNKCMKRWKNISRLSKSDFLKYGLNHKLVNEVINEQLLIIEDRLENSPLPLDRILSEQGCFDGNWKLINTRGKIFATDGKKKVGVKFKLINKRTATSFHRDLHYIHTPRTNFACGFYIEGSKHPFSIEAIEPVDRIYKKAALIAKGFDPTHCIELTRLYNWPGSPKNTTSLLDKTVFNHFKTNEPNLQAVITTIMPNYTLSKSQIAGGITDVLMIKPLKHKFIEREIKGKKVYEHLTNRRLSKKEGVKIIMTHPDFPMLPVIELLHEIKRKNKNYLVNKILVHGGRK